MLARQGFDSFKSNVHPPAYIYMYSKCMNKKLYVNASARNYIVVLEHDFRTTLPMHFWWALFRSTANNITTREDAAV